MPPVPNTAAFGSTRRAGASLAAQHLAEQPKLSAEAARMDALDHEHFEKQAAEFARPTTTRPALITADEIEKLRAYKTGAGQLSALVKITSKRLDYWTESQGGGAPFDVMTDESRALAEKFFHDNGTALAGQPRVAPPNPLKPAPAAAVATAQRATPPAGAPAATEPKVELPAKINGAEKGAIQLPPPATLDIEYLSAQGFLCRLHLQAASWSGVLELGGQAAARLAQMDARPVPAPAASAPAGQGAGTQAAPPVCKYHGAMKQSKKPGAWFCPKKMANGEYCDQKYEEAA